MDKRDAPHSYESETRRFSYHSIACELHPWRNEDNYFVNDTPDRIAAGGVFDGVGSYTGSEKASKLAADIAAEAYSRSELAVLSRSDAAQLAVDLLMYIDQKIDEDVYARVATTAAIASVHIDPETSRRFANIAWAGDSRVYIIRDGKIIYRTLDDGDNEGSYPELDDIFPDETPEYRPQAFLEHITQIDYDGPLIALTPIFRYRNAITNSLDGRGRPAIHLQQLEVTQGDIILITTDGVHDNLTNPEIISTINNGASAEYLTQLALERSRDSSALRAKPDDITAVMLQI